MEKLKYTKAPSIIWGITELTANERILLFNLAYLEKDGKINTTQAYLGKTINMAQSNVSKNIKSLKKKGYISYSPSFKTINTYIINWKKIESQCTNEDYINNNIEDKEMEIFKTVIIETKEDINNTPTYSTSEITDEERANEFINKHKVDAYRLYYNLQVLRVIRIDGKNTDADDKKYYDVLLPKWKALWDDFGGFDQTANVRKIVMEKYNQRYVKDVKEYGEFLPLNYGYKQAI